MKRRNFLKLIGATGFVALIPTVPLLTDNSDYEKRISEALKRSFGNQDLNNGMFNAWDKKLRAQALTKDVFDDLAKLAHKKRVLPFTENGKEYYLLQTGPKTIRINL